MKNLLKLLEAFLRIYETKSTLIVASTSKELSKKIISRHTYSRIIMIWNLDIENYL